MSFARRNQALVSPVGVHNLICDLVNQALRLIDDPHAIAGTNSLCTSLHHGQTLMYRLYTAACFDLDIIPDHRLHQPNVFDGRSRPIEAGARLDEIRSRRFSYFATRDDVGPRKLRGLQDHFEEDGVRCDVANGSDVRIDMFVILSLELHPIENHVELRRSSIYGNSSFLGVIELFTGDFTRMTESYLTLSETDWVPSWKPTTQATNTEDPWSRSTASGTHSSRTHTDCAESTTISFC